MTNVIAFGSFDPLHEGHIHFLQQAKKQGDHLLAVVARDSSIRARKHREPHQSEEERLRQVAQVPVVDEAILGNRTANSYELLDELEFDVVALGYDQQPSDQEVRQELDRRGKQQVRIVRFKPHKPEKYKSSYMRSDNA